VKILLVKPDISDFSVGFTSLARTPPLELLTVAAPVVWPLTGWAASVSITCNR